MKTSRKQGAVAGSVECKVATRIKLFCQQKFEQKVDERNKISASKIGKCFRHKSKIGTYLNQGVTVSKKSKKGTCSGLLSNFELCY